ncbi:MAG: hypothetical protein KJ607_04895, partial [Bacteroidetes bacterium]|nr:hypothetical protein [Bacteroidota bacterium]
TLMNQIYEFDGERFLKSDSAKTELNTRMLALFEETLQRDGSFGYPFDSLKWIGRLKSEDGLLRIYTWNLQFTDHSFNYYGFIHYYLENKNNYLLWPLTDRSDAITDAENLTLDNDNWFGALYYNIIARKDGNKTLYTLLGWDGNSDLISKKLVDVLTFTRQGKPVFGAPVFITGNKKQKRVFFRYSSKVSMLLRYDPDEDKIVFDHLAPVRTELNGQYQFYGPDMTHDAFGFSDGNWNFISDIKLTNPKNKHKAGNLFNPGSDEFYNPENR